MFERCLRSIDRAQNFFDLIVISLNGHDVAGDRTSIDLSSLEKSRVRLFETGRILPFARHIAWGTRAMKPFVSRNDHVLLMAHDDELDARGLDHWARTRPSDWNLRAYIGDYRCVDDRDFDTPALELQAIPRATSLPIGLSKWLDVNAADPKGHVFTNMSGMSVPYSTLLRVARFLTATRMTKGARFEYILVASRSNRAIDRRSPPVGVVHSHPGQEGRSVPPEKQQMDEARYCLWLLLNAKTVLELQTILRSPWGLRRLIRSFLKALFISFWSRLDCLRRSR